MKKKTFKKIAMAGLIVIGLVLMAGLVFAFAGSPKDAGGTIGASGLMSLVFIGATGVASDSMTRLRTVKYTHSAAVVPGDIIVGNGKPLQAVETIAANVEGVYILSGKMTWPKKTGTAFTMGDKVYFDPDDLNIQSAGGNNILCGYCLEGALSAATTITILLWPISVEITDAAADSKADSVATTASTNLSVGDSKAASLAVVDSTNKSIADSKTVSLVAVESANLSTGDSKAASLAVVESTNLSTGDSKAASLSLISSANLSGGESKNTSQSVLISTLDSKVASYHA
jgi:predicted RecA/RadA family phage recombinase